MAATVAHVWWHPHHIEYAFSLTRPQHWPQAVHSRSEPDPRAKQQYYKEQSADGTEDRLLYRKPVIGMPSNRPVIRDDPDLCPVLRPGGFHGRSHQADGPPEFWYQGPLRDELYWYERNVYQPRKEDPRLLSTKLVRRTSLCCRNTCLPDPRCAPFRGARNPHCEPDPGGEPYARYQRLKLVDDFKRLTQDGVGYL